MRDRLVQQQNFDSDAIAIEAASWVLQLDNGPLSPEDRAALREWAGRSPAHGKALRDYAAAWIEIDDLLLEANEIEKKALKQSDQSVLGLFFNPSFFKILTPIAATLIVVSYLAIQFYFTPPGDVKATSAVTYSTQVGEQAQFKLADGSTVHLNTGSVVEVELQPQRRLIRLLKGEAHFDVAHDKARPFDVIAHGKQITAVGTAFAVRLTNAGLNVTVTEGTVVVAPRPPDEALKSGVADSPTEVLAILEPNDKMVVEYSDVTVARIQETVVSRQLSWREGVLTFEDDSLAYVIDEISRYTDVKIILADDQLEDLRIGGLFKMGEIDALLTALKLSFDLDVERINNKTIRVSRRAVG